MNILIKENVTYKLSQSSIIFRNRLESELLKIAKDKNKEAITFCYIFLQIFVEVFLHNSMRIVINLEDQPKTGISKIWEKKEGLNIDDKRTTNGKLTYFIGLFGDETEAQEINAQIQSRFKNITKIRNHILHGHEISWGGAVNGEIRESSLKKQLKTDKLKESINEANEIGAYWNQLLRIALKNSKSLQNLSGLEFKNINIPAGL